MSFSDDFNTLVLQVQSGTTSSNDMTLQQLLSQAFPAASSLTPTQMAIISYVEGKSNNWTTTNQLRATDFAQFGLDEATGTALIAITAQLEVLTKEAPSLRQTTFNASVSDYETIIKGFGSQPLSWYYNTVGKAIINSQPAVPTEQEFITVVKPYRPPKIVPIINADLIELSSIVPSAASLAFFRKDQWKIYQSIPIVNEDSVENQIWKKLPAPTFESRIPLFTLLNQLESFIGNPTSDSKFIAGINQLKVVANEVNSLAVQKGYDYDAFRWMYDGPETAISTVFAASNKDVQTAILSKFSTVVRDNTIVSYSSIEYALQQTFYGGIELNFSAALTQLAMFAKINMLYPGFISQSQARTYIINNYKLVNVPSFIFTGIGIDLQELVEMGLPPLTLGPLQPISEITITKNEIILLGVIGVGLLVSFIAGGNKGASIRDAFNSVRSIVADTTITIVILVVFAEVAVIYSKTGSVGGTIAQILSDGVILFVDVLEDLIKDLWNALKGEWAKLLATIGAAAATIGGAEAVLGGDLIVGAGEIAAGEEAIAGGEIIEGGEQETGDVIEGFEKIF